jgi:hypothetical protein
MRNKRTRDGGAKMCIGQNGTAGARGFLDAKCGSRACSRKSVRNLPEDLWTLSK